MNDASDLRRRLSRLGKASARKLRPSAAAQPVAARGMPPGAEVQTPWGPAFLIESMYSATHRHGSGSLGEVLDFSPTLAGRVAGSPGEGQALLSDWAFLDLETTGLAGGAGTLSFLIGVGAFVGEGFRVRQYFLRDPAEESGMLHALQQDLERAAGFVTFNGRAFDVPLLEMRYQVGMRRRWRLSALPQLDLLYPARRLWRRGLPDCRLATLEAQILQVRRTEEDVPGELIPGMYLDYLRTGDASSMARVIYHNAVDILSLVGLAVAVLQRHHGDALASLSEEEALAVARWHQGAGRNQPADTAYQAALRQSSQGELHLELLRNYTAYLKRAGRRDEAVAGWRAWHERAPDDPLPCVELSMYYEWHVGDLASAHYWAQEALMAVSHWSSGWRRDHTRAEIEHRLRRLERKLADPRA